MAIDNPSRNDCRTLRGLLHARRRELTEELQRRRERIRETGANTTLAEYPDGDDSGDLEVVLVDLATATLHRIDQAIERLDEGRYGVCTQCRGQISEARLRVMPFAVCCQQCEAAREREGSDGGPFARRRLWTQERVVAPGLRLEDI